MDQPRAFGDTPQPEQPDPEQGVPASETEQAEYDLVVARGLKFIHDKGRDQVLKLLSAAETPAQGIGMVTANLIRKIEDSAKQAGRELDPDILYSAAAEFVQDLNALAQKEKVYRYDNQEEAQQNAEDAMLWASQYYGQEGMARGELDQGTAQNAMQQGLAMENPTAPVTRGVRQAMYDQRKPKGGLIGQRMGAM